MYDNALNGLLKIYTYCFVVIFLSRIGVFVAKGDIGIGTIVGSAVFNLLFVIGLCGLVAGKVSTCSNTYTKSETPIS